MRTFEEYEKDCEFEAVIESLAGRHPGTVDYDSRDDDRFDLLDENEKVITTITEMEMTNTWNEVESGDGGLV